MGNSESSYAEQLSVCDGKYDVCCALKANVGGGECMSAKDQERTIRNSNRYRLRSLLIFLIGSENTSTNLYD